MLQIFRKYGNSFTVKALMLLLVFTFAVWGIGDVIRGHNRFVALKVGDVELSDREWFTLFNTQLERIKMQFNAKISKEDVKNLGLHNMILSQLMDKLLLQQEAKNNGILISDNMVKYELLNMPMFQVNGKFDKGRFQQVMQSLRMSEQQLFDSIKEELSVQYESFALKTNRIPPADLVDVILEAKGAIREVNVYNLPYRVVKVGEVPKTDDLMLIYNRSDQAFTIPEKRDVSYVTFGMEDIKIDENISNDELKQFYEQNKERFREPEKRSVLKLEFKDQAKAEEAKTMLDKGEGFESVGKKFFPSKQDFSIGDVTNVGFEKEIAEAIFGLKLGQHSKVVKTPIGYLIFKVTAITPEGVKSFDEVRNKAKGLHISELRYEKLNKISQDIDQLLASGKMVDDVATLYGFKVNTLVGIDTNSVVQPLNDVEFKQVAFATSENNTSMVGTMKSQDKFFVLQVNKLVPSRKKEFSEVKGELEKLWYNQKKEEKLVAIAHELSEQLKAKGNVAGILAKYNLTKPQSLKFSYYNMDGIKQPKEFLYEILKLKSNEITEPFKDTNGYLIAHVASIGRTDPSKLQDKRKEVIDEYVGSIPNEIMSQYLLALRSKYKIEINRPVVDRVLE